MKAAFFLHLVTVSGPLMRAKRIAMNHRLLWMLLAIGVFGCSIVSGPLGAAGIPEAKPLGWVADVAGLLSAEDVAELERLGETVFSRDRADLVVLTVDSTRGADPRSLATATFNRWRLGDPDRKNGILIFVAIDDRAAEILLGDGIDGAAEVAKSDRIMQEVMVPRFRAGEPAGAVVAGARACAFEFFGVGSLPVEAPPQPQPARAPLSPVSYIALATATLMLLIGILAWLQHAWLSHRANRCKKCRKKMTRLEKGDHDPYLEPGERAEERVRSVGYQVWQCRDCGEVAKLKKNILYRKHHPCKQCGYDTALRTQEVERQATQLATGLMKVNDHCQHCGHVEDWTSVIPEYRPPSPSVSPARRSDSGARSFRGGSSSFGGGSRSSRGGGSSSGRGSSGRW
jgi:uncharacterized protein